tara:strand:+ start:2949 stop:5705 length:2757 start_codon:yes stop_codon:yes gene_type:complete
MAQKPRTQVDVPFGKAPLRPTVQGAGTNQVFVAPLPRLNSSQILAKNLAQFSNVLGQFSNVQKQRGREAAMGLTNDEVIAQLDGSNPRRFNPFDKIGFQKQFSEDVYTRGFDLKVKPQLTQLGNNIKQIGVERIPDALALDKVIDEGLAKINEEAIEGVGDDKFQAYAHNVLFSNEASAFRAKTHESWNFDRQQYRKDASAEGAGRSLVDTVEEVTAKPPIPEGGIVVLKKHRSTAYGNATIDPTTAEDQRKADAGTPGYEGFSQTVGSSGRKLIPGYSVASNYYPQGTILDIDGKKYRVDDTGGMAENVVDFYAGDDQKMYKAFANKKIKSIKVVDPSAKSPEKVKGGVQAWVSNIDEHLQNSGHPTTGGRKAIILQTVEGVVTDYAARGDFIKAREIADSLEEATANNIKIFKGNNFISSLYEKIEKIEGKTAVDNVKVIEDKADNDWLKWNSRLNDVKNISVSQEVIPIDRAEDFEDTYETETIAIKEELIELKEGAKETGDATGELVYDKLIEKVQQEQLKHGALIETFSRTYLASDALEKYEIETLSLEGIQNKIFSSKALEGKLWMKVEDSTDLELKEVPVLINQEIQEDIEEMALEVQTEWNQKNRSELRTLKSLNLYKTDGQLQDEVNKIIDKNSKAAQASIQQTIQGYIEEAEKSAPVLNVPKRTPFQQQLGAQLQEGESPSKAKKFALAATLEGKDTFNAKDGDIILDVDSVFGWGDATFGNFEIEDYDKYNSLFKKTKETGVFKDNPSSVSEFFENRKIILKESDFFKPLISAINRFNYKRPSINELGAGGLYYTPNIKPSESEVIQAKVSIKSYLKTVGIPEEDAKKGEFLGYPTSSIVQLNWRTMPILTLSTLNSKKGIKGILKANGLDKKYIIRDITGAEFPQKPVTEEEFIKAQRAIIEAQTK